jgi:hypothetical protein
MLNTIFRTVGLVARSAVLPAIICLVAGVLLVAFWAPLAFMAFAGFVVWTTLNVAQEGSPAWRAQQDRLSQIRLGYANGALDWDGLDLWVAQTHPNPSCRTGNAVGYYPHGRRVGEGKVVYPFTDDMYRQLLERRFRA